MALDHTRAHGPRLSEDTAGPDAATSDPAPAESGSISELGLSARLESSIRGAGVATVDDLVARSAPEVLAMAGVGPKSFEELTTVLAGRNLALRTDD
ncbi:MAG: hypothetical protein MK191_04010 [Acidimicrobiales bacterium]|nr:hypothetical protein [Acidimicrobiales bacterium]